MPDLRPVGYVIGLLVAALGASMLLPMALDAASGSDHWMVFLEAAVVTSLGGGLIALASANGVRARLTLQQIFLLTTGVWVALPLFGAIPFILGATGARPVDAVFEAMSGLTTTGSTVFTGLDSLPQGLLLWRSMLQWFGGVGIIVEALTDNRNRAASEVRTAFAKHGGNLGETGSVSFMFDRVGAIECKAAAASEEVMLDAAIEAGADDAQLSDDLHEIYCAADRLGEVAASLETKFGEPEQARLVWRPQNLVPVEGQAAESLMKLMSALDDCDDVQNVYANFDIAAEEMERLAG